MLPIFISIPNEFCFFCHSCFLKKRTLWSLERALSLLQRPPWRLAPEPQRSTLRLWSTAPKKLALLTLQVPSGSLCPAPPSPLLAFILTVVSVYRNKEPIMLCLFLSFHKGACETLCSCMTTKTCCGQTSLKWLEVNYK